MKIKLLLLCFGVSLFYSGKAQEIKLKKGVLTNFISVNETENFSLYLPTAFSSEKKWPVLFVFDVEGKGRQAMGMFKESAEKLGYILASSNQVHDSLSTSKNILIASRMIGRALAVLPIDDNRVYTAGFSKGAGLASVIPLFVSGITGVISCGSAMRTTELLNWENNFHFIGIVGREDYNYKEMIRFQETLNKMKFPNQLLKFDKGHQWPNPEKIEEALRIFTLSAMKKGWVANDSVCVKKSYINDLKRLEELNNQNKLLRLNDLTIQTIGLYKGFFNIDSLKKSQKLLKKNKVFKYLKKNETAAFFKEFLLRDDYMFYLEEDVLAYNFNNLGWWSYQMNKLQAYIESNDVAEQQMGKRLLAYVNAIVEDTLEVLESEEVVEVEAVHLLWMLKTITNPKEYGYYLKIISDSAKTEDYGTALFYLEEALKNGYKNMDKLYSLENTAILKITPEYNQIISKYLKESRYTILQE